MSNEKVAERVLILAPIGRDGEITSEILSRAKIQSFIVPDMATLGAEIDRGCGAVIITAEALTQQALEKLRGVLERQPQWSELPIMVFVSQGSEDRRLTSYEIPHAHMTLVDRPIHVRTLISTIQSALRSRSRQYEIKALLNRLEHLLEGERRHADRLAGLAEASLSIASALSLPDVLKMITEEARTLIGVDLAVIRVIVAAEPLRAITSVAYTETYKAWESYFYEQPQDLEEKPLAVERIAELVTHPIRSTGEQAPDIFGSIFEESDLRPTVRGLLAAPLVERGGHNIGFIALSNRKDGDFTADDEAVLVQLAQMASAAVQNARLYREAQEANRAKDDFLATLAHELRTPMTAILGWVQMLRQDTDASEEVASAIEMIEASTRVQARLVEDLLDVSRIIAGKLSLTPEAVELAPLIETIAASFSPGAAEREVELTVKLEPEPLSIWGDPTRLQQVVWNLLSNAIKFTSPGGRVELELTRNKSDALVRVKDTGQGIAPEFLPHVFERFRQADTGTTRARGGLGLGLAIVRHLVEMHGGAVEALSDGEGKGAEFRVRLPLNAIRRPAETPRDLRLDGAKVLVVDDDLEARRALVEVFGNIGVDALAVGSVNEAMTTLRSFNADLVISDIAMPGEDGYALIRRLKESKAGKDLPAVALTGYGRPEDKLRILSSGFRHYVQKPVDPVELVRLASDLIQH